MSGPRIFHETTHPPDPPAAKGPPKSETEKAWDAYMVRVDGVKITADVMVACAKAVGKTEGDVGEELEAAFESARAAHQLATAEEGRAFVRYQAVIGQGDLFEGARTRGRSKPAKRTKTAKGNGADRVRRPSKPSGPEEPPAE